MNCRETLNVAHAWLTRGLDEDGIHKLDGILEAEQTDEQKRDETARINREGLSNLGLSGIKVGMTG